jgi:hypothetical protein
MSTDEFVAMTMAFADQMAIMAPAAGQPFLQAREELRRHLIDSAAAISLTAYCDGMNCLCAIRLDVMGTNPLDAATKGAGMKTAREFAAMYRMHRACGHSIKYSAWVAWQIAVKGTAF